MQNNIDKLEKLSKKNEMAKIIYEGFNALDGDRDNQLNHLLSMTNILIESLEKSRKRMLKMIDDVYEKNMEITK